MQFTPWDKPMGTDGCAFVEAAAPDPKASGAPFESIELDQIKRGVLAATTKTAA